MTIHNGTDGIFQYLLNSAAFFDKIAVAVWGTRRKRIMPQIKGQANIPIGGPRSHYARCMPRRHVVTGNRLQLRYGLMRPYQSLSPFALTMWAGESPVTCADVMRALDGLMRRGYKAVISHAELTFDTKGIPLWRFGRDLCTRARVTVQVGGDGRETLYVGGTRSPWQVRIYTKGCTTIRVEFILRSAFLRAHGIHEPQDLLLLKKAQLWSRLRFREVDHSEGYALPARVREPWLRNGLALPPSGPASIIERALRDEHIGPARWVVQSDRETLLRKMQKNLIW
jgi:hypothetical protein